MHLTSAAVNGLPSCHLMLSANVSHNVMLWEIERRLAEDDARPILFYPRTSYCWQPQLKGLTIMANSIYNGNRYEDLWLDQGVGSSSPPAANANR